MAEEEKTVPPEDDSARLQDTSPNSISAIFKTLVTQGRKDRKGFHPALASLNSIVTRFHTAGLDRVGIELATFENLRPLNLYQKSQDGNPYLILSILDAKFLLRAHDNGIVDGYTENLNKPRPVAQQIDADEFWYKNAAEFKDALFSRYDLNNEQEMVGLMNAIVQTAASCTVLRELQEFDAPANDAVRLVKPKYDSRRPGN